MKLAKWITSWNGIAQIPIPLDDKEQMAYMGLIEAVDKYDPEKGNKFSCCSMVDHISQFNYYMKILNIFELSSSPNVT